MKNNDIIITSDVCVTVSTWKENVYVDIVKDSEWFIQLTKEEINSIYYFVNSEEFDKEVERQRIRNEE